MIPWYSVTYSDGLEHIFISWKLVGVVVGIIIGILFMAHKIKGA